MVEEILFVVLSNAGEHVVKGFDALCQLIMAINPNVGDFSTKSQGGLDE